MLRQRQSDIQEVCVSLFVLQPTFRYEQSGVEQVREIVAVVVFSFHFLVALFTDDESREGAIH